MNDRFFRCMAASDLLLEQHVPRYERTQRKNHIHTLGLFC
jgi:hypothetical protein